MSKPHLVLLLSGLLAIASAVEAQSASPVAHASSSTAEPGVLQRVEKAVVHGAKAAASGVERGLKAANKGVEHGVKAAAGGVEHGVKAAASGVQRGAEATGGAVKSVAKKVGGPAGAASQASK